MEQAQKNRIITRLLQEKSQNSQVIISVAMLADYKDLDKALDFLETHQAVDFDALEDPNQPAEWLKFSNLIASGTKFSPGSPPQLTHVNEQILLNISQFWQRDAQLVSLPQNNFFDRRTQELPNVKLGQLVDACHAKYKPLIETFFKRPTSFNPADNEAVKNLSELLKSRLSVLEKGSEAYKATENKIAILEDLNKINQLSVIEIPQEPNGTLEYCKLAEATAGVTEKISLVSLPTVITQLEKLTNPANALETVEQYNNARADFKLGTEAILKLPKHGDIREVQRESMALNVSRLLDLNTTKSCMVTHQDQPALFVPFDNIKLLREFAKGQTFTAGFSGQTYEHYSTINPVGEGLQADRYVDDFGASLGLFHLCSDTDAIGGYNQNKALKDDRSLYIFDQVIMPKDKLKLDSRLSMQPDQFMMKHTRHGQGRNRTLIEDSAIDSKFDSLMKLKEKAIIINQYADRTLHIYQTRMGELRDLLNNRPSQSARINYEKELKNIGILHDDAMLLKASMARRIAKIDEVLPKHSDNITPLEVKQALIFEKLMHNPALFTADGRPYKNPWTNRHSNPIKTITDVPPDSIRMTFDKIDNDMFNFIKNSGIESLTKVANNEILISRNDLLRLNESLLHPEHRLKLDNNRLYLNPQELNIIGKAYGNGSQAQILSVINNYQNRVSALSTTPADMIKAMEDTERSLKALITSAKEPGFGLHVLKKFHFDAQQKLQSMLLSSSTLVHLNDAFAASLKLDKVSEFNHIVQKAITNNQLDSPAFQRYLEVCVEKAGECSSHSDAVRKSTELSQVATETLNLVTQAPLEAKHPMAAIYELDSDELAGVDPIAQLHAENFSEQTAIKQLIHAETVLAQEEESTPVPGGITSHV